MLYLKYDYFLNSDHFAQGIRAHHLNKQKINCKSIYAFLEVVTPRISLPTIKSESPPTPDQLLHLPASPSTFVSSCPPHNKSCSFVLRFYLLFKNILCFLKFCAF